MIHGTARLRKAALHLLIGVFLTTFATASFAASVSAGNPQSLVSALQDAGYKAKLLKDGSGDPKILTSASGEEFEIYFHGCASNANCKTVQFVSVWRCDDQLEKCKAADRKWNAEENFSHTVVVDGSLGLYYYLMLSGEGMSAALFESSIERFAADMTSLMADF